MATEIFQFGPGKAKKIGIKVYNLTSKFLVMMDL